MTRSPMVRLAVALRRSREHLKEMRGAGAVGITCPWCAGPVVVKGDIRTCSACGIVYV